MRTENTRRLFLHKCFSLGITASAGSLLFVAACKTVQKPVAKAKATPVAKTNPCEDMTGVDPVDVEKRKALGYVSLSPMPDKQCDGCKLWIPVAEGKECGGCLLFTGPISPEGNCTYWAPQV